MFQNSLREPAVWAPDERPNISLKERLNAAQFKWQANTWCLGFGTFLSLSANFRNKTAVVIVVFMTLAKSFSWMATANDTCEPPPSSLAQPALNHKISTLSNPQSRVTQRRRFIYFASFSKIYSHGVVRCSHAHRTRAFQMSRTWLSSHLVGAICDLLRHPTQFA